MTTERRNDDESLSDLPEPQVTEDEASDIKGGATLQTPVPPTSLPSAPRPVVPRLIDPCW